MSKDKKMSRTNYYQHLIERFFQFVIPADDSVLEIKSEEQELNSKRKFDYVIISDLINSCKDVQKFFKELHLIINENSRIIITTGNRFGNWLSRQDIKNLLSLAQFEVVKEGSLILLPIYLPLISLFFNKYLARLPILRRFCSVNYFIARQKFNPYLDKEYSVSVIIPARNEAANIENAIIRLPKLGSRTEIIFVEGGSKDDTRAEIDRVIEEYKDRKDIIFVDQDAGVGKGDAVRKGFERATGDILMILDADLTVRPEDLPKFYQAIRTRQGEFVMGNRLLYPMEQGAMRFLNILGNKFFSWAFSWLLEQPIKDTLCGTKVIYKRDYEILIKNRSYFGDFDPFGDFDLIFGAAKLNLKILEIPIHYQARTYGVTNISRFRHGWLLLKMTAFAMRKMKFVA